MRLRGGEQGRQHLGNRLVRSHLHTGDRECDLVNLVGGAARDVVFKRQGDHLVVLRIHHHQGDLPAGGGHAARVINNGDGGNRLIPDNIKPFPLLYGEDDGFIPLLGVAVGIDIQRKPAGDLGGLDGGEVRAGRGLTCCGAAGHGEVNALPAGVVKHSAVAGVAAHLHMHRHMQHRTCRLDGKPRSNSRHSVGGLRGESLKHLIGGLGPFDGGALADRQGGERHLAYSGRHLGKNGVAVDEAVARRRLAGINHKVAAGHALAPGPAAGTAEDPERVGLGHQRDADQKVAEVGPGRLAIGELKIGLAVNRHEHRVALRRAQMGLRGGLRMGFGQQPV